MTNQVNECAWRAATGGSSDFTVASPLTGFFTPAQCTNPAIVEGGEYHYRAESDDFTQHESGKGTYTAGVLTRDTIYQSSNGGEKVTFSAAPRVRLTAAAQDLVALGGGSSGPTVEEITVAAGGEASVSLTADVTVVTVTGLGNVDAHLPGMTDGDYVAAGTHRKLVFQSADDASTITVPGSINVVLSQLMYVDYVYDGYQWRVFEGNYESVPGLAGVYQRDAFGAVSFIPDTGMVSTQVTVDIVSSETNYITPSAYTTVLHTSNSGEPHVVHIDNGIAYGQKISFWANLNGSDTIVFQTGNITNADGGALTTFSFTNFDHMVVLEWYPIMFGAGRWRILDHIANVDPEATGLTSELIGTGASPVAANVGVDVTYIISGGTGGLELVTLPAPPGDWNANIDKRHKFFLTTQTAPGDKVRIGPDYAFIILEEEEQWVEVYYSGSNWYLYQGWVQENPQVGGVVTVDTTGFRNTGKDPGLTQSSIVVHAPTDTDPIGIDPVAYRVYINSDGVGHANAISLNSMIFGGNPIPIGQRVTLRFAVQANPADTLVLNVANVIISDGSAATSVVFDAQGEYALLEWTGAKWQIKEGFYTCTVAPEPAAGGGGSSGPVEVHYTYTTTTHTFDLTSADIFYVTTGGAGDGYTFRTAALNDPKYVGRKVTMIWEEQPNEADVLQIAIGGSGPSQVMQYAGGSVTFIYDGSFWSVYQANNIVPNSGLIGVWSRNSGGELQFVGDPGILTGVYYYDIYEGNNSIPTNAYQVITTTDGSGLEHRLYLPGFGIVGQRVFVSVNKVNPADTVIFTNLNYLVNADGVQPTSVTFDGNGYILFEHIGNEKWKIILSSEVTVEPAAVGSGGGGSSGPVALEVTTGAEETVISTQPDIVNITSGGSGDVEYINFSESMTPTPGDKMNLVLVAKGNEADQVRIGVSNVYLSGVGNWAQVEWRSVNGVFWWYFNQGTTNEQIWQGAGIPARDNYGQITFGTGALPASYLTIAGGGDTTVSLGPTYVSVTGTGDVGVTLPSVDDEMVAVGSRVTVQLSTAEDETSRVNVGGVVLSTGKWASFTHQGWGWTLDRGDYDPDPSTAGTLVRDQWGGVFVEAGGGGSGRTVSNQNASDGTIYASADEVIVTTDGSGGLNTIQFSPLNGPGGTYPYPGQRAVVTMLRANPSDYIEINNYGDFLTGDLNNPNDISMYMDDSQIMFEWNADYLGWRMVNKKGSSFNPSVNVAVPGGAGILLRYDDESDAEMTAMPVPGVEKFISPQDFGGSPYWVSLQSVFYTNWVNDQGFSGQPLAGPLWGGQWVGQRFELQFQPSDPASTLTITNPEDMATETGGTVTSIVFHQYQYALFEWTGEKWELLPRRYTCTVT